jgi:hypothetical protein
MKLFRDRQCSVCHWSGPRGRLMRCPGGGFICQDGHSCQVRYQLRASTADPAAEIKRLETAIEQAVAAAIARCSAPSASRIEDRAPVTG